MSLGSAAGVAATQVVLGRAATVQDVNVTDVQGILVNTFGQRIHGPPFSPPPGPAASYYNVTGAGSPFVNGQLFNNNITYNGLPQFCGSGPACLYSEGGVWRLAIQGKELFYVANEATIEPPLTGWHCANGTAPAPTLVAGP